MQKREDTTTLWKNKRSILVAESHNESFSTQISHFKEKNPAKNT